MRYELTRVINRVTKNTWNCSSEFMNGHSVISFIVAHYDCAEEENRKGGRSTLMVRYYLTVIGPRCVSLPSSLNAVSFYGFLCTIDSR